MGPLLIGACGALGRLRDQVWNANFRFEILRFRRRSGSTVGKPLLAVIGKCGQALKGVRWMSWHREATKDAAACEKLRGAGKRALIRRCLNAETRWSNPPSLPVERIDRVERTQGTETSKYLQEKKKTIDSVSSGERKRRSPNRDSSRGCGHLEGAFFPVKQSGKSDHRG
jgi:hypothetical protein